MTYITISLDRNDSLPESQTLPHSEFELDPRITLALEEKVKADRDLMMKKIAFQVLKSRLIVKKMQNHFVDRIASLDVTVRAIKLVPCLTHDSFRTKT